LAWEDIVSTDSRPADGHLPLTGLVVLDLTVARAGPTCVRHLADWGADVIRVEAPNLPDDLIGGRHGSDFQNLHRNKRTISLDLKSPEGHAAFMRLVQRADVLVENMRVAVKHRLGIDYDAVSAVNPRLVYGSISGFGQTGPYAARAGVDQIAQGLGGLMSITGLKGQGPVRVGIPITDLTAGNLLAMAISMALFDRERTGQGRWVYTSLLEAQVFMLDFQATRWLMEGKVPDQAGNDHPTGVPTGVFPTSDGYLNLAAPSNRLWERLCETLGQQDWADNEVWQKPDGRNARRAEINAAIAAVTRTQTMAHWVELFEPAGIPCGPINTIDRVFADPQVEHLGMAAKVAHPELGDIKLVNSPVNMNGVDKRLRSATPE
jgi:crotonobetainyl-CoA:carnitine CoA-transferase CaiB-like acyl-CoA transferase